MKKKLFKGIVMTLLSSSVALVPTSDGLSATANSHASHGEEGHHAPNGMSVKLTTRPAPGGILVRLHTRKLMWSPEHLSPVHGKGKFTSGEGHSHIYVDGSKTPIIIVGPWTYLALMPGHHTLRVTLNGNDHLEYRHNGHAIQDRESITVARGAR
jgi:hypothetical protein